MFDKVDNIYNCVSVFVEHLQHLQHVSLFVDNIYNCVSVKDRDTVEQLRELMLSTLTETYHLQRRRL